MAIKTETQGTIPTVKLEFVQYDQFNMTIKQVSPYMISLSAITTPYGVNNDKRVYGDKQTMSIPDVDAYISTKVPEDRKAEALQALGQIQNGLGVLHSIVHGSTFIGVQ